MRSPSWRTARSGPGVRRATGGSATVSRRTRIARCRCRFMISATSWPSPSATATTWRSSATARCGLGVPIPTANSASATPRIGASRSRSSVLEAQPHAPSGPAVRCAALRLRPDTPSRAGARAAGAGGPHRHRGHGARTRGRRRRRGAAHPGREGLRRAVRWLCAWTAPRTGLAMPRPRGRGQVGGQSGEHRAPHRNAVETHAP